MNITGSDVFLISGAAIYTAGDIGGSWSGAVLGIVLMAVALGMLVRG